jgi:putative flippase GtrA
MDSLYYRNLSLYVGVGGLATASHYATTCVAVEAVHCAPLFASTLGFAIGATMKYWLSYSLTFRSTERHHVATIRFGIAIALLLVLNAAIFAILNKGLNLHYVIAQIIATVALIWPGYWINRQWVFRTC